MRTLLWQEMCRLLVDSRSTSVKSFTYGKDQFYADKHEQAPLSDQSSMFKSSFADSAGESAAIPYWEYSDCDVTYTGQLTYFVDRNSNYLPNLSIGQESLLLDFPDVRNQISASMRDLGSFSNVAVCLQGGGYNLHHFLFEILPSIFLYEDRLKRRDKILLGATNGSKFLYELIDLLNLNTKIQEVPVNSRFYLDNFDILGHFLFRIYPIGLIQQIREIVLRSQLDIASNDSVVFMGRGDNERNRRNLSNEADVVGLLNSKFRNLEILRPALSTLTTTINKVKSAKIIVGQTGGALANLIWAEKLEHFVELVPIDYHGTTEAEELSKLFGFKYSSIYTQNFNPGNWRFQSQICDLEDLRKLLLHF